MDWDERKTHKTPAKPIWNASWATRHTSTLWIILCKFFLLFPKKELLTWAAQVWWLTSRNWRNVSCCLLLLLTANAVVFFAFAIFFLFVIIVIIPIYCVLYKSEKTLFCKRQQQRQQHHWKLKNTLWKLKNRNSLEYVCNVSVWISFHLPVVLFI